MLATDFDGTLADHGVVSDSVMQTLERARAAGHRLVLVTGRELDDIVRVFPALARFDYAVVENGAVLFDPARGTTKLLATPPPRSFVERVRARGAPLSCGRVICSTVEPYEHVVLETIRELGLELQVIFNKGSAMVLPTGVNKATGLVAGARELGLSLHGFVAFGDAENDHVMLQTAEIGVAVANALPALKTHADYVTRAACGDGVAEFVREHLLDDCRALAPTIARHAVPIGRDVHGAPVSIPAHRTRLLIVGNQRVPARRLATTLVRALVADRYQVLAVDGLLSEALLATSDAAALEALFARADVSVLFDPQRGTDALSSALARLDRSGVPHWIVGDASAVRADALRTMAASGTSVALYVDELVPEIRALEPTHIVVTASAMASDAARIAWDETVVSVDAEGRPILLDAPRAGTVACRTFAIDTAA